MAAAEDRLTLALAALLCWMVGAACVWRTSEQNMKAEATAERVKANELVANYAQHIGASGVKLNPDGDTSVGELGFHYDPSRRLLTGRIFIMKLNSDLLSPEVATKAKSAMLELNSPELIPLFERAGGHFEFDASKDMLFLKKDFAIELTTSKQLREQMDELADVGAKWTFRWFKWAMQITYGYASPPNPPLPVTRQNDSQHNEFKR